MERADTGYGEIRHRRRVPARAAVAGVDRVVKMADASFQFSLGWSRSNPSDGASRSPCAFTRVRQARCQWSMRTISWVWIGSKAVRGQCRTTFEANKELCSCVGIRWTWGGSLWGEVFDDAACGYARYASAHQAQKLYERAASTLLNMPEIMSGVYEDEVCRALHVGCHLIYALWPSMISYRDVPR